MPEQILLVLYLMIVNHGHIDFLPANIVDDDYYLHDKDQEDYSAVINDV